MNFRRVNRTTLPSMSHGRRALLWRRLPLLPALVIFTALFETQCVTTDAVSKFASQSSQALAQGQLVLQDIQPSCVRTFLLTQQAPELASSQSGFATVADQASAFCQPDADAQRDVEAVSKELTNYFNAISQLASALGGSSKGGNGKGGSTSTSAGGGSSPSESNLKKAGVKDANSAVKSYGAIVTFISGLVMRGYQEKKLAQAIAGPDPNDPNSTIDSDVRTVLTALNDVATNYEAMLDNERSSLRTRDVNLLQIWYKNNQSNQPPADPAVLTLLRDQWDDQVAALDAKRAAAEAYCGVLKTLSDADAALAKQAKERGGLKSTDLINQLQKSSSDLSTFVPALEKVL
jgi:hypothetical protein